jgi:hypothetical protein
MRRVNLRGVNEGRKIAMRYRYSRSGEGRVLAEWFIQIRAGSDEIFTCSGAGKIRGRRPVTQREELSFASAGREAAKIRPPGQAGDGAEPLDLSISAQKLFYYQHVRE